MRKGKRRPLRLRLRQRGPPFRDRRNCWITLDCPWPGTFENQLRYAQQRECCPWATESKARFLPDVLVSDSSSNFRSTSCNSIRVSRSFTRKDLLPRMFNFNLPPIHRILQNKLLTC